MSHADGSAASGECGTDTLFIGGLAIENQVVETVKDLSPQFSERSSDGLLGLAFKSINSVLNRGGLDPQNSPVDNLAVQENLPMENRIFTTALYGDSAEDMAKSFCTFGCIDVGLITASGQEIHWVDINNTKGYWMFASESSNINENQITRSGNTAIANTATPLILVSDEVCEAFYNSIPGAKYDAKVQGYVLPKETNLDDIPEFSLEIGGQHFGLRKQDIAFSAAGAANMYGVVQSRGNLAFDILGSSFLKTVYAVRSLQENKPRLVIRTIC
jgi:hypothetical protein